MLTLVKPFIQRCVEPPARWLIRRGATPNALTLAGLFCSLLTCLFLVLTQRVVLFCLLILLLGLCDMLDGAVARLSGRVTKFGAYLDAMADRYVEIAVTLAAAYVTGYWVLSLLVLGGAFATSYAKARAAMEIAIANNEWPDFLERGERCVLFVAGLLAAELTAWRPGGHDLFYWTLVCLAVATHATVLQRMWRARRLMAVRGG